MSDSPYPSILDREITKPQDDRFGHRHFADILCSYITAHEPPYTIGLLGPWGVGKSSIRALYENSPTGKKTKTISFNAWRFSGDDLKRALLGHAYLQLGGDKDKLDDALYKSIQIPIEVQRDWKHLYNERFKAWCWVGLSILAVIALIFLASWFYLSQIGTLEAWTSVVLPLLIVGLLTHSSRSILQTFLDPSRAVNTITKVENPATAAEQYIELLLGLLKKNKSKWSRIVIFVDDLDRLPQSEMIDGLEAVRAFLEIQSEGQGPGIVFVISCDEAKVASALRARDSENSLSLDRFEAQRYLDRIFQFRIEIPPLPRPDMRHFALERLKEILPKLDEQISKQGVSLEVVVDRMVHAGIQNPREVIQLLNAYTQSWCLAIQREKLAGKEERGGLSEGAVTKHPISLAALTAFRVSFPGFYSSLQETPSLLKYFEDAFIRGENTRDWPEPIRVSLRRYGKIDQATHYATVANRYRPLVRLVSSFGGLRWPKALRPLLLLSQDPVTRSLGDKGPEIYDSLASGYHHGVLEALNRHADTLELKNNEAAIVKTTLYQGLSQETETRRNNAIYATIKLLPRMPGQTGRELASYCLRRLTENKTLRDRVGVPNFEVLINKSHSDEWASFAESVANDFFDSSGFQARTETNETPSLEDAHDMARVATTLLLRIGSKTELTPTTRAILREWLKERTVSFQDSQVSFEFAQLEEWAGEFEEFAMELLEDNYALLLADELNLKQPGIPDFDAAFAKVKKRFQVLFQSGEESRTLGWDHLILFAGSRTERARLFAQTAFEEFRTFVGSSDAQDFLEVQAKELANYELSEDDKELPPFVRLVSRENITKTGGDAIMELAIAITAKHSERAVHLVETFISNKNPSYSSVVEAWSDQLLLELPLPCTRWMGVNFSRLTPELQNSIVDSLNQRVNPNHTSGTNGTANDYKTFISSLPDGASSCSSLEDHIAKTIHRLQHESITHWNEYRELVLPCLPELLRFLEKGPETGAIISKFFIRFENNAEVLVRSHKTMKASWFPGIPNSKQLFDKAKERVLAAPQLEYAPDVLESLRNLISTGLVAKEHLPEIAEIAVAAWPHHREAVAKLSSEIAIEYSPQQAAQLLDSISEPDEFTQLKKIWSNLAQRGQVFRWAAFEQILQAPSMTIDEQTDIQITTWLELGGLPISEYIDFLLECGSQDEEKARFLCQVIERMNTQKVGPETSYPVLAAATTDPEDLKTIEALLTNRTRLPRGTKEQREEFSSHLLYLLTAVESMKLKNHLAEWLSELKVKSAIEKQARKLTLSDQDQAALSDYFKI